MSSRTSGTKPDQRARCLSRICTCALRSWFCQQESLQAQSGVPTFRADRVLPSGGDRPVQLAPGMLVSIYGTDLGPRAGCIGQADTKKRETPSPLRPDQAFVETLIYPTELCGVQVMFGETPVWAAVRARWSDQLQSAAGRTDGRHGAGARCVPGPQQRRRGDASGSRNGYTALEQPAHVGGPVWVLIQAPPFPWHGDVQYPVGVHPADFGCHEVEVRRNGTLLRRIPMRPQAESPNGPMCGNIGIPGHEMQHKNRLPLHLQYRFDKPGPYEVRYTRRRGLPGTTDSQPVSRPLGLKLKFCRRNMKHRTQRRKILRKR